MKAANTLIFSAIALTLSTGASANIFDSARIYGGTSSVHVSNDYFSRSLGHSVLVGAGYDFNQYVGAFVDAEKLKDDGSYTVRGMTATANNDVTVVTLGADIGQKFNINDKFSVKPYVMGGARYLKDEMTVTVGNTTMSDDSDDVEPFYGLGVRATLFKHLTASIEYSKNKFETTTGGVKDKSDLKVTTFKIGYQF